MQRPNPEDVPNLPDPPSDSEGSTNGENRGPHPRPPLRHFPSWVEDLWNILQDEGATELMEEGPVIYVGSYYVSHETCIRQEQKRPLRLNRNYEQWSRQIIDTWHDHFDRSLGFSVHRVQPEPPIPITQGLVGVLLVVQHPVRGQEAVLTTVHREDLEGHHIHEVAHSFPTLIDTQEVLARSDALSQCREVERQGFGPCFVKAGNHVFDRLRPLRVHDGLGLVIRIPILPPDDDWEHRVLERIRRGEPPNDPAHDQEEEEPDHLHLMARQFRSRSRSTTSPSATPTSTSSACSSESGIWKRTVVFNLEGQAESMLLPWDDGQLLHERIAASFHLEVNDIQTIHYVAERPADLVEMDLQCMLLQRTSDALHPALPKLLLVDMELFVEQEILPFAFRRYAEWLPQTTTRLTLLRLLGVATLCQQHADRCSVWHNNQLIDAERSHPMQLQDGDFIHIFIGDADQGLCYLPDGDHTDLLQLSAPRSHKTMDQHVKPIGATCDHHWRAWPRRRGLAQEEEDDGHHQRFRELWDRPNRRSRGLMNEEVMLFDTWFLSSMTSPRCSSPRTIALPANVALWQLRLRQVWRDRLHPHWSCRFVHVKPDGIGTRHGGHLIILQYAHPDEAGVLFSSYHGIAAGQPVDRFAQLVPRTLTFELYLRFQAQARLCLEPNIACNAFHGDVHISPTSAWIAQDGHHLEPFIHHDPNLPDAVSLMQRNNHPRGARTHGLNLPARPAECRPFQFNVDAPVFNPLGVNLFAASEFVDSLQRAWTDAAFSWEEEGPSCQVAVWFIDHGWQWPHATAYRVVRLHEDTSDWERRIIHTWPEYIVPGALIELHLVHPKPWTHDNTVAGHVLVIQRPQEAWVTSLVTVYDDLNLLAPPRQMAVTTHEHILLEVILTVLNLLHQCIGHQPSYQCQAHFDQVELFIGRALMGRCGYGIDIHMRALPRPVQAEAPVLLQLSTLLQRREHSPAPNERLTTDTVAHGQWPLEGPTDFPEIGQKVPQDWVMPEGRVMVRIHHNATSETADTVPTYVEMPSIYNEDEIQLELRAWGHDCQVFLCGAHDDVFVDFSSTGCMGHFTYVFCSRETDIKDGILVRTSPTILRDLDHTRWLHSQGYTKAVLMTKESWHNFLTCIHFEDVQPKQAVTERPARQRTPWPSQQEVQTDFTQPFQSHEQLPPGADCLIQLDMQELHTFLTSAKKLLWTDFSILDLPDFVKTALEECQQVERIDRYVIFTDGSSQTQLRHKPPLWVAEHDISDSWAFAVFAEQYGEAPGQASRMQFMGFQCHQVLYDPEAPHYVGTERISSDSAETEALLWAGLWRVAQNDRIPTIFVSDSRLVGDQAAGGIGTQLAEPPFYRLREVFQTLEAILPGDQLRVAHVRSHAGDPYNELVDWLAKREGQGSLHLPRQPLHMKTFTPMLKCLWMLVQRQCDLPRTTQGGLDVSPVPLPPITVVTEKPATSGSESTPSPAKFQLSFATANVRTFYKGNEGFAGKLAYVREQFVAHKVNFLGLQEARTECGSSLQHRVLRLAGGSDKGQLGVELWINLGQPYAWHGSKPSFFERTDFVVVSTSHRHLLVHVHNHDLDFWLLTAHAPHSGAQIEVREDWWHQLTTLVTTYTGESHLVVMIDANAPSGPSDERHIFAFDDHETPTTKVLRQFLQDCQLCAPSTLDIHDGPRGTWTSPVDGSLHRIDYVLVPCSWKSYCTWSGNLEALDFGHLGDHQAVSVQVDWHGDIKSPLPRAHKGGHDRTAITSENMEAILRTYCPSSWDTDIEQHVAHFNAYVNQQLHTMCPPRRQGPKKVSSRLKSGSYVPTRFAYSEDNGNSSEMPEDSSWPRSSDCGNVQMMETAPHST